MYKKTKKYYFANDSILFAFERYAIRPSSTCSHSLFIMTFSCCWDKLIQENSYLSFLYEHVTSQKKNLEHRFQWDKRLITTRFLFAKVSLSS